MVDPDVEDALILESADETQSTKQTIPTEKPSENKTGWVVKRTAGKQTTSVPNIEDNAATCPSILNLAATESKAPLGHTAAEIPTPDTKNWVNNHATIKTDPTSLNKDLNHQLSAMQAATSALLSGDTQAAQQLAQISQIVRSPTEEIQPVAPTNIENISEEEDKSLTLTPLQKKITNAVIQEREKRASRSSAENTAMRDKIQTQLNTIMKKAESLKVL